MREAKLKVKGTILLAVLMYAFYVFLVRRDKYRKGKWLDVVSILYELVLFSPLLRPAFLAGLL